jgi:CheY-like chemotaxis protein
MPFAAVTMKEIYLQRTAAVKILVVDDDRNLAGTIQEMVEEQNHVVRTAENGEEGYSMYLHFKPDLVITDIQMPLKNGFELARDIRKHNPKIKIIYMSGAVSQFIATFMEEKKKYAVHFLRKPFTDRELMNLLV